MKSLENENIQIKYKYGKTGLMRIWHFGLSIYITVLFPTSAPHKEWHRYHPVKHCPVHVLAQYRPYCKSKKKV